MQIKTVIKDKKFKEDYISIDGSIYRLFEALKANPNKYKKIYNTFNGKLKPAGQVHLKFRTLPSYEKLLEKIEYERYKIYQKLSLKQSSKVSVKKQQATKLLAYLCENLKYDISVKEDIFQKINPSYLNEERKQNEKFLKSVKLLNEALKEESKNKDDKVCLEKIKLYGNLAKKQHEKLKQISEFHNKKLRERLTENIARGIYSSLFEGRGVCADFSWAYSYLLNGLKIENAIATVKEEGDSYHALNLVGFYNKNYNDTRYAYVDVTTQRQIFEKYYKNNNNKAEVELFKNSDLYLEVASGMTQEDFEQEYNNPQVLAFTKLFETPDFRFEEYRNKNEKQEIVRQIKTKNDYLKAK